MGQLRSVVFIALAVVAVSVVGVASTGRLDHEIWFVLAVAGVPAVTMAGWPYRWRSALVSVGIEIVLAIMAIRLFHDYRDDPWFSTTARDCDGPCTGWYSFENPVIVRQWILVGLLGAVLGALVLAVRHRRGVLTDLARRIGVPDR